MKKFLCLIYGLFLFTQNTFSQDSIYLNLDYKAKCELEGCTCSGFADVLLEIETNCSKLSIYSNYYEGELIVENNYLELMLRNVASQGEIEYYIFCEDELLLQEKRKTPYCCGRGGSFYIKDLEMNENNEQPTFTWKGTPHYNFDHFVVTRWKKNNWDKVEEIGIVPIINKNYELQSFSFTDTAPLNGTSYYSIDLVQNDSCKSTKSERMEYVSYKDTNLLIYPNPTSSQITIEFNPQLDHEIEIQIFNQSGVLVKNETFDIQEYRFIFDIDVSEFPQGIYFIKSNLHKSEVSKFVISR